MKRFIISIKTRHLKTLAVYGLEAVLTIVLVLVFFALFSLLLNGMFPSGAGINEIVNREQSVLPADRTDTIITRFQRGQVRDQPAAVLTTAHNTVK
jgi:hypothetical protein